MKLSPKNVAQAIYESAKGKSGEELDHALFNARNFLSINNLISKSSEILHFIQKFEDEDTGVVRAKVASSVALSQKMSHELEEVLKKRYGAEHILLDLEEDPSLLGGLKIEAEDEVIDLSIKNKMSQLSNYLLQA
ncbi:MAG: ATP synthase F1 subunit delta [Candidatus Taylorbacteria bacterium]